MPQSRVKGGAAMLGPRTNDARRAVAAMVIGALIVLALPLLSHAQQPPASAELKRVVGRVEILRKGQTQWVPAVIGAQLVEGDDIRAFSGASAELTLPDTSTVVLAENSRLLLSKLEFDRQNQSRTVLLHLAVGKMRAAIAQASVALVRLRQSNFAISTPTAVAAARGTVVWAWAAGNHSLFAVEHERGALLPSRVDCIPLRGVPANAPLKGQPIFAGSMSTDCGAPTPIVPQFLTLNNPSTASDPVLAGAPVVVPLRAFEALTLNPTVPTSTFAPGMSFNTSGTPSLVTSPTSTGRDLQVNQQQSQNQINNNNPLSAGQPPAGQ
jgi:FecR protein